jgi:hypothetical protein
MGVETKLELFGNEGCMSLHRPRSPRCQLAAMPDPILRARYLICRCTLCTRSDSCSPAASAINDSKADGCAHLHGQSNWVKHYITKVNLEHGSIVTIPLMLYELL